MNLKNLHFDDFHPQRINPFDFGYNSLWNKWCGPDLHYVVFVIPFPSRSYSWQTQFPPSLLVQMPTIPHSVSNLGSLGLIKQLQNLGVSYPFFLDAWVHPFW